MTSAQTFDAMGRCVGTTRITNQPPTRGLGAGGVACPGHRIVEARPSSSLQPSPPIAKGRPGRVELTMRTCASTDGFLLNSPAPRVHQRTDEDGLQGSPPGTIGRGR